MLLLRRVFVESIERLMRSRVLTTAVSLCTATVVVYFVMDPCLVHGTSNYDNAAVLIVRSWLVLDAVYRSSKGARDDRARHPRPDEYSRARLTIRGGFRGSWDPKTNSSEVSKFI